MSTALTPNAKRILNRWLTEDKRNALIDGLSVPRTQATKLGKCAHFSLPPISTCPGSTSVCGACCYAVRFHRQYEQTREAYQRNLDAVRGLTSAQFVKAMLPRIPDDRPFRIHVSGDFFSKGYIASWRKIAMMKPRVSFFGFTRSWRVARLADALVNLNSEPNVQILASIDENTGLAPAHYRYAFMGYEAQDKAREEWGYNRKASICANLISKKVRCSQCRWCIDNERTLFDIVFPIH